MPTKWLNSEILAFLANMISVAIPVELLNDANRLNIKSIYFIGEHDLSKYGVYGNHIVVFNDGKYADFATSIDSVKEIIASLNDVKANNLKFS